jgi:acyl-CoA thioester hydrolase
MAELILDGMAALIFRHHHRVSYADCTVGNHVYYGRYLELLEAARGEFFRQAGAPFLRLQQEDTIFPVVECRLRYKAPARYDDVLTIEVWLIALEKIRLNFAYRIVTQNQTEILQASTFHVCTGLNEKPKRLPPDLSRLLQPYLWDTAGVAE